MNGQTYTYINAMHSAAWIDIQKQTIVDKQTTETNYRKKTKKQ